MRIIGITASLLLGFALMVFASGPLPVSAQESVTCNLLTPTIIMTEPGAIRGTSGDDVIVGTAGDDIIDAGSGNDTVCGEGGNDVLDAGTGDDLLVDPAGFGQILRAGDGADRVIGFGTLDGGSGDDNIRVLGGAAGSSTLSSASCASDSAAAPVMAGNTSPGSTRPTSSGRSSGCWRIPRSSVR